jgi:hypothetical protein
MAMPEIRTPEPAPSGPRGERGGLPPWLWVTLLAAVVTLLLVFITR